MDDSIRAKRAKIKEWLEEIYEGDTNFQDIPTESTEEIFNLMQICQMEEEHLKISAQFQEAQASDYKNEVHLMKNQLARLGNQKKLA